MADLMQISTTLLVANKEQQIGQAALWQLWRQVLQMHGLRKIVDS